MVYYETYLLNPGNKNSAKVVKTSVDGKILETKYFTKYKNADKYAKKMNKMEK